ncbi:unnamed protein product, partial [Effrenium voratum]
MCSSSPPPSSGDSKDYPHLKLRLCSLCCWRPISESRSCWATSAPRSALGRWQTSGFRVFWKHQSLSLDLGDPQLAQPKCPRHAQTRSHLATPCGLLINELCNAPQATLRGAAGLLQSTLERDTGRAAAAPVGLIFF